MKIVQAFQNLKNDLSAKPLNETDKLLKLMANDPSMVKRVLDWQNKALSLVRNDVKQWKNAWTLTQADEPKNFALQLIYDDVMQDSLLTSQVENRINKCLKTEFSLVGKKSGEKDVDQSMLLTQSIGFRTLLEEILNSEYLGYSLVELMVLPTEDGVELIVESKPRTNIIPKKGLFLPDYSEDKGIEYRTLSEFGTYILEFDSKHVGLINKAVPHVLFKKFALSCWSELCEIFGIPPRIIKTDTQNRNMLNRATKMMQDTGAAAWFIIDESETMEFGQSSNTNGDVFKQLIASVNNEISMLISGAIIAQDTTNGNRSKDESAREVLEELVQSDLKQVEMIINTKVIPALVKIGFLKGDLRFEWDATEDLSILWSRTKDSFSEFNVNPEFVKSKFGIDILSAKNSESMKNDPKKLNLDFDFFD